MLEEFVARLELAPLSEYDSTTNSTLDANNKTFPLTQSIYADATHEDVVLDVLTALNLTALFKCGPLPASARTNASNFVASHLVPFGTHLTVQVLECAKCTPSRQIRFIV